MALFRLVFHGHRHKDLNLPPRYGYLFDPNRFPFLEGRLEGTPNSQSETDNPQFGIPLIGDGTIFRLLQGLFFLNGERISYRTLDVEQIGSVYETMMGFGLTRAAGRTIAIRPQKKHGAAVNLDLDQLLSLPRSGSGVTRLKFFSDETGRKLSGKRVAEFNDAETPEELLAAFQGATSNASIIARNATPHLAQPGFLLLQPTGARRKSGSHYTPRKLTEPIVRKALEPVLARLGENPFPAQILDLKICDNAVGSGAFLVEACRQLGDALVKAWAFHGGKPVIPPDEDEVLHARRLVAQRCLYGVDRNPMAADLAKLSLWLSTLAKDHPFTFLDHSIRSGDSLVGLSKKQILAFHWDLTHLSAKQTILGQDRLEKQIKSALAYRQEILQGGDYVLPEMKAEQLRLADDALAPVRLVGDLAVLGFFSGSKPKERQDARDQLLQRWLKAADLSGSEESILEGIALKKEVRKARESDKPVASFHWEIEFPEVFDRQNSGFDAMVGNPPYAGKNTIIDGNRDGYLDWLKVLHEESHGNADLVAHFFRRAFNLLRRDGTFGLIATNTIRQGDTRHSGLRWICVRGGGTIYAARRRYKWVGAAAVTISVVWVVKGSLPAPFDLDGKSVPIITAYLFHDGGHENPAVLSANAEACFEGVKIYGMGFTFDDTDKKHIANPLAELEQLTSKDPRNAERVFAYLGGEEVNNSPTHSHHRYVINFSDFPLRRVPHYSTTWQSAKEKQREEYLRTGIVPEDYPDPVAEDWPDLLEIVARKVKPERERQKDEMGRLRWWRFLRSRSELYAAIKPLKRVLTISRVTEHMGFAFLPVNIIHADRLALFPNETSAFFGVLQSRIHELWARFFSVTLEDRLSYTPSDCFETFPFPVGWETDAALDAAGREYYDYRAALMVRHNEGLTTTYNRFHDRLERDSDILHLRDLHAQMDRAVLDAYGWTDISTDCEFIPDYMDEGPDGEPIEKSLRYRWPDAVRDEVLARLLKLNAERFAAEVNAGLHAKGTQGAKKAATKISAKKTPKQKPEKDSPQQSLAL